jgi:MFS family permease
MAFWRTPVVALMPDITPSKFRSQANGIINFMGGVGAIIALLGGASLYKMNPAFPFWMGSFLVILASLLVFLFIKEPKVYETGEKQPGMWQSLQVVLHDSDRSALRILLAIFFWFLAYTAVEAFFNLYAINQLSLEASDGARLMGQLSFIFVLFALPAGYIGGKIGRRPTIIAGILLMAAVLLGIYWLPVGTLVTPLTKLPALGVVPVLGILMMVAGAAWALININSLPMVVDMTVSARIGTYTGLYYLFSTLSAIVGPNSNSWIIKLTGNNYNSIMLVAPFFLTVALFLMIGVRGGEAVIPAAVQGAD